MEKKESATVSLKLLLEGIGSSLSKGEPVDYNSLAERFINYFYSEPQVCPKPEQMMICPECGGFGQITIAGCSGTKSGKCPVCKGTSKVSPPEPVKPEERLPEGQWNVSENYAGLGESAWATEKAALLKANADHQKQVEELKVDIEELCMLQRGDHVAMQARIKELERISSVLEQQLILENKPISEAIKEARADQNQKIGEWLNANCKRIYTSEIIVGKIIGLVGYDKGSVVAVLKQEVIAKLQKGKEVE